MSLKAKVKILNLIAAILVDIYLTRCNFRACLIVFILWVIATLVIGFDDAMEKHKKEQQNTN